MVSYLCILESRAFVCPLSSSFTLIKLLSIFQFQFYYFLENCDAFYRECVAIKQEEGILSSTKFIEGKSI